MPASGAEAEFRQDPAKFTTEMRDSLAKITAYMEAHRTFEGDFGVIETVKLGWTFEMLASLLRPLLDLSRKNVDNAVSLSDRLMLLTLAHLQHAKNNLVSVKSTLRDTFKLELAGNLVEPEEPDLVASRERVSTFAALLRVFKECFDHIRIFCEILTTANTRDADDTPETQYAAVARRIYLATFHLSLERACWNGLIQEVLIALYSAPLKLEKVIPGSQIPPRHQPQTLDEAVANDENCLICWGPALTDIPDFEAPSLPPYPREIGVAGPHAVMKVNCCGQIMHKACLFEHFKIGTPLCPHSRQAVDPATLITVFEWAAFDKTRRAALLETFIVEEMVKRQARRDFSQRLGQQ